MYNLRDYQTDLSIKGVEILKQLHIVYFAMQVRTGKTITSLETAKLYGAKKVLFLTKKKAIPSIESDYTNFKYSDHFELTVLNDESMHKNYNRFDLIIHDEHHRFGAFPKMGKYAKTFKQKYATLPIIFLSGTPHAESYSQIFHQFFVSDYTPFTENSFYKWAKTYVDVKKIQLGYAIVNDYKNAYYKKIQPIINPYMITFTQDAAGFKTNVKETVLICNMKPETYELCKRIKRDRVIEGKDEVILADTAVKLQQKLHQLYSGTIKFESGNRMVIDNSKAIFIKEYFEGKRIGIFYKFKAELIALKEVFKLTQDVEQFNDLEYDVIALQFISGREGISLRTADSLVYYNIDFSAVTYFQSKDRLTTMQRKENDVYWVFSRGGIEQKIYQSVIDKKDYTNRIFKKDFGI